MTEQTLIRPPPKWQTHPREPAWVPAPYLLEDVMALKACWAGEATPDQQRSALEWIIMHAGKYGEMSYRSEKDGGATETAFAQGRWFVAQQVQKLIGLEKRLVAKLRETENGGSRTDTRHDRSGS